MSKTEKQKIKLEKVDDKTAYVNLLVKYADLEKENAELKEHHKSVCETLTNTHRSIREQLTKAKEIIKDLLENTSFICSCEFEKAREIKEQAEQFLKEIEK